jgi:hypothetical protein
LFGSSPEFTGTVNVYDGTLQAGESGGLQDGFLALGQGEVIVHPTGRLVLTPVSESKVEAAPSPNVRLNGGSLFGVGIPRDDQINFKGTIEVIDDSEIYLMDGIATDSQHARLIVDGRFTVAAGKTLSIIGRSDSSGGLSLTEGFELGPGSVLGGTGVIRAHAEISGGAILSPGLVGEQPSVGRLAMSVPVFTDELNESRMIWGENGRYRWEINDTHGLAGAPFGEGWDLVNVGPELVIEATEENPFVIEVIGLQPDGAHGPVSGLAPLTSHRWAIAKAAEINEFVGTISSFDPDKFVVDVSQLQEFHPHVRAQDFWLELDGPSIYLNATIRGDFNRDGIVNAADYTVWRDNEIPNGYATWKGDYGNGSTTATVVPEPSNVTLCLSIASLLLAGRRSGGLRQSARRSLTK